MCVQNDASLALDGRGQARTPPVWESFSPRTGREAPGHVAAPRAPAGERDGIDYEVEEIKREVLRCARASRPFSVLGPGALRLTAPRLNPPALYPAESRRVRLTSPLMLAKGGRSAIKRWVRVDRVNLRLHL